MFPCHSTHGCAGATRGACAAPQTPQATARHGGHGVPRGMPPTPAPGLAPVRRDTLHPSESALPRPGQELVLSLTTPAACHAQGAGIPAWADLVTGCPGVLGEWDNCSNPAPSPQQPVHGTHLSLGRHHTHTVPSLGLGTHSSGVLMHWGPAHCQLPPPHTRVLKLCCQCSPTHTHCPRSLLTMLTCFHYPRCSAKARNRSLRPPCSPWLLSTTQLHAGAAGHMASE